MSRNFGIRLPHEEFLAAYARGERNFSYADFSYEDFRGANFRGANFSHANFRGANLSGADLGGANLSGAILMNVIGNGKEIFSAQLPTWNAAWTETRLQIGCQSHAISSWFSFDDHKIDAMDEKALAWWRVWKPALREMIINTVGMGLR